jgi:hypothetical protein
VAAPQARDTLLLTACTAGLVTIALLVAALLTGRDWWIAIVMTAATAWFGIPYIRERRRFGRGSGGPAQP